MTPRDARWLRRFLLASLGLAVAGACSTPEYNFVPDPTVEHCANEFFDEDLEETDTDCGGPECRACELGKQCVENADCLEGMCIEGFCQAPGCDNGVPDEGETGIDCGGMCKPCETGDGCVTNDDCVSLVCTNSTCAAPSCTDGIVNGTETGRDCGGGFCDGCGTGSPCNTANDCLSLVCEGEPGERKCEVTCGDGLAECDGVAPDCETMILTDEMHCGDCETVCDLAHAVQSCVSGNCQIGDCESPYDDCDNEVDNGCETNTRSVADHCGMCGNECSNDHGTPSCASSACQIDCDAGFEDCDDDRVNGCERSVSNDVQACGSCTNVCPFSMGETPFCVDGMCGATVCPDGLGNCDGQGDSCEQDLTGDVQNCGRCGGLCTVNHGTPRCDAKACGVQTCDAGWGNCDVAAADGGYANGCETNTNTEVANCGACGNDCTVSHGTAACVNGECRVGSCDNGWSNCDSGTSDGGYANGCEINIAADKTNCGVCGTNCDTVFAPAPFNATGQCVSGLCQRDQCLPNFGDCDTNAANCESDFRTDEGDCGNCDTACVPTGTTGNPGNECLAGTCTPTCDATHANCDTMGPNGCEINKSNNASHCGGCNMACTMGRPCISSMCGCSGGLTLCDDMCVDTVTNNAHCGMCGLACTGGRTCQSSVCQCPTGQTFCGGVCVNMQTDEMNCGVCGRTCDTPAGTTSNTCTGGACVPVCDTLRASCDMEPWDGCETNFANNDTNCGACNRACQFAASAHVNPATQAGNDCSAGGVCQPICATGWDNCDNEPWDGCEADITTDTNCGTCGTDCAGSACGSTGATSCCVASGSARACQAQITIPSTTNDVEGSVAGPRLDNLLGTNPPLGPIPLHALQAGTNRVIIVAVASETGGGGVSAARPDVVTYGGTTMTVGPEMSGGSRYWSPDLFTYYITEAGLGAKTGNQIIVVDGAPATPNPGSPGAVIANVVQFNGARQTTPISAFVGGILTDHADPDTIQHAATVATAGSRIYSIVAGLWASAPSYAVTPAGQTLTQLLNTADLSGGGTQMRASAVYVGGGSAAALATGSYTISWTGNSDALTHLAIVIHPAQQ